jgi:hypothetical protein
VFAGGTLVGMGLGVFVGGTLVGMGWGVLVGNGAWVLPDEQPVKIKAARILRQAMRPIRGNWHRIAFS